MGVEAADTDVWTTFTDRDSNTWEQGGHRAVHRRRRRPQGLPGAAGHPGQRHLRRPLRHPPQRSGRGPRLEHGGPEDGGARGRHLEPARRRGSRLHPRRWPCPSPRSPGGQHAGPWGHLAGQPLSLGLPKAGGQKAAAFSPRSSATSTPSTSSGACAS
ncbi:MAG: hypothetical protein R3F43_24650 [bacterium]